MTGRTVETERGVGDRTAAFGTPWGSFRRTFPGPAVLLVVLSLLLAFAFQGSRGLYETTEGRYAESAREMIETGDWFVPRLDYEPHWSKPPLTYWALAGGMLLFGENEWGVRAGPAVAYLVTVWAVYGLGLAMWGRRAAFAAALVYATAPFVVMAANSVSTDPFLAMWEALAALAYWRALAACPDRALASASVGGERRRPLPPSVPWIALFWLFSGLGFLTKGPPALLTMLVVFIFHAWRSASRRPAPSLASPLGIGLFFAVGFGWFIAVGLRYEGLIGRLITEEVVGRVSDPGFNRNPEWYGPFVIVLPLVFGLGAWLAYWPGLWRRLRGAGDWRSRVVAVLRRDPVLFCVLWAAVPTAVLCVSRSRLPLYALPFVPALALVTGRAVALAARRSGSWRRAVWVALATGGVMLSVKGIAAGVDSRSDIRPVYEQVRSATDGRGPVYAYGLKKEHGLMFYLGGRMTRLSAEAGGRTGTAGMLGALTDGGRTAPAAVVARSHIEELAASLSEAGLKFDSVEVGRYTVFSVPPVSPDGPLESRNGSERGTQR